jgi:hypothetical protein
MCVCEGEWREEAISLLLLPPFFYFYSFLRDSCEPSSFLEARSCLTPHLASLPAIHVIYVFLYPRTISSCRFLTLSVCRTSIFFFFSFLPQWRFPTSACLLQSPRSFRFLFLFSPFFFFFLTLTILYFSASVLSMFVFSAHMLKINS